MNEPETRQKLSKCFRAVFPDIPEDQIDRLAQDSFPGWDSISAIVLMNVLEEEFEIPMDLEALERLTSFDQVLIYLNREHASGENSGPFHG